jgi:hypothetical protein
LRSGQGSWRGLHLTISRTAPSSSCSSSPRPRHYSSPPSRTAAGAIHLFHPIAELETGFDHAFLVGILFIVGMIVLTVQLRESDVREEARE